MKILILDDKDIRHETLAAEYRALNPDLSVEVVSFKDPYACCDELQKNGNTYDLVCLDHDLEWFDAGMYGGTQEVTGYYVAKFIANVLPPDKMPKAIRVHSWNPDGARVMMNVLRPLQDAGVHLVRHPAIAC